MDEPSTSQVPSIRHVGVCLDRSAFGDRVIPHAVAMAKAFGAKLTVLHVLEPPHEGPDAVPTDALDWEVRRSEARRHLAEVGSAHSELSVGAELLEGRPAEEIRDWVEHHRSDLTVLASHGASGWTEWSLASTARKLIEGISGSVLVVPAWSVQEAPKGEVRYGRILVLLDGSARAESALPEALGVARAQGSELLLLHVVPSPQPPCPCPGPAEGNRESEADGLERRIVERNARAAETYLEGVKERLSRDGLRVRTRVAVDGDVRGEILQRIAEDHVDLVVLAGHGQGGRAELPFGSVASFLLEHATAPLLVVRKQASQLRRTLSRVRSRSRGGVRLPPLAAS